MTVAAIAKRDSDVARLSIVYLAMATTTADFDMQTGERITRERMVEAGYIDCFPFDEVMTLQAIHSQPALVLILMAVGAAWGHTKKCLAEILDPNGR